MLHFEVVGKSQGMHIAQTCDLLCGGNVSRKQHWAILVDVSKNALAAVIIVGFWLFQALMFLFIARKQHLTAVNSYLNSIENRSLDVLALSDNFCIEISLQMNYSRKNKTTLMMFWPIWSANPESAMEMMLLCLHWRKQRLQLNFFQWMETSA